MSIRSAHKMSSPIHRKRQWFLKRLWDAVIGDQSSLASRRRFGRVESLEERRVLATLYATSDTNDLLTFDSSTPGTIATSIGITGLDANTIVRGIDFRPATGQLYALGIVDTGPAQTGRLYTLNITTAVATPVGPAFSTNLADADAWEIDFNPTVDRLRVVSDLGDNLRLNPNDGSLVAVDTSLSNGQVRGVAYDRNEGGLSTLYAYNYSFDRLATIGGIDGSPSPNGGAISNFGNASGIIVFGPTPFDIESGSATGFMTGILGVTSLISLNLTTGIATNSGSIGSGSSTITGLAAPLPFLTIVGTAGPDTLVVNATGPNSGSYSLNGGPAVPFNNLNRFSFNAGGGDDTLTINNPAGGLFAPTGGIDYNGGGQAGDALQLLGGGGAAYSQTYFVGTTTPPIGNAPGNNGSGLVRFAGPTPVDVRFTGLAPILDTVVAASLTVSATDAANNISVTNGAAGRLVVAVDAFEPIEFTNKSQLTVNAGDGIAGGDTADTVLLNFSNLPTGLSGITINGDEGADTISLQAAANVSVTLAGGDGLDIINVGNNGTVGAPGLLTPVAGAVNVNGGPGGANLIVDGSGAAVAADYAITGSTVTRSIPAGFGGVTYSSLNSLLLTVGAGANVISVNGTATGVATNIATGAGDDSIILANGVSLNGGTIDGGANNDTIDYSAFTTSVSVNLGSNAPGGALSGVIDGGQENPGQVTTATGTVAITNYNSVTKTFDISAHVSNLLPAAVTGFHIHRAPVGVNGPIIIDLAAIYGLGSLIADGAGGFNFNATGVALPPQHEAALLGGITYFNVHTAAAPGGLVRGQILPNAAFVAAPGTATGTGGISNIENATGGTGADSLVGDLGANALSGGDGNDTIVGAPGNDTMNGGNNNDTIAWSNGDNTDVIDGAAGVDVVQVNGSLTGGDNFTIGANGSRVAFARTNLVPFALDIGTTESLVVNGAGGDDTQTVNSLAGVADLTAVNLFGLNGNDTFNTGFASTVAISVNGGTHTTGDTLNVDAQGGPVTDSGTQLSKPGFSPINITQLENLSLTNIGDLTITGSGADDTLVVNATSANSGTYRLNSGPVIGFAGMTKLTFNSIGGSDALTINNPAGGLFAPTGGIDYNGGGQAGDALNLLGGGAADLVQTYFVGTTTPPIGVGPGNSGDGLVRFTGSSNVDIRFTGLAPIVDTVLAASLTVNSTDGANNISVTNGAAPRLVVAVDAFEPIEFNNKSQLIVNAGDGVAGGDVADTILVNFNNLPAGLAGITINADEGADAVSLRASSNVPVTLNGGAGLDVINIGNNGTLGTPGLLTPVAGPVIVNGGADGADLIVDGTGAAVPANYEITATTVTRSLPAGFGGVTYSNLTSLLLTVGAGPNVVTVSSTSVPTTADANGGIDTLIINTPNAITVYEQAGNYGFELGFPGGLTALDFENILLQPGSGVLNVAGDQGQGTNVGGAGVDTADLVQIIGTAPNAGGLRLSNIALPQFVQFVGVTNLYVNTFDLDDDVVIDPFASTTQDWNIVVNVNAGNGDDDISYGNVTPIPGLAPTPDGSAAAVSENVKVQPTLIPGSGEIAVPGVVTIHFQNTEDLSFLLNDGGLGDTDTLTIQGTDSNLSDQFTIRPDVAGNDAEPLVDLDINAVQILQIENIATVAPGGAQFFATAISFEGLAGDDRFNVLPSANGTVLNIDGGAPSYNPVGVDQVVIDAPADPTNQVAVQTGATNDSGTIAANLAGLPRAAVNYNRVESITVNNSAAAAVLGTNGDNSITVTGTAANAVAATVDGGPALQFNGVTSLRVDALAGDDNISVTVNALAITGIAVIGGDPTASDKLVIVGTAGNDNVLFTPTSDSSGSLTGLATPVTFDTTESIQFDGLGGTDTLTVSAPAGNDTIVVDHGTAPDAGTVRINSLVPIGFLNLGAAGTLALDDAGGLDRLIINGSSGHDNFAVNVAGDGIISYQSDVSAGVGGTNHLRTTTTNAIEALLLNALDGDDNFIISASTFYPVGLAVNAGNPSAGSDRVTINGTAAADNYVLQLQAAGDSVTGVVGGPVVLNNVEDLTFSTGAGDDRLAVAGMGGQTGLKQISFFSGSDLGDSVAVSGTINNDSFQVTPQSPTDATVTANNSGTTVLARLGAALTSTLTVSGTAATDTVFVHGTSAADAIAIVKGAITTVAVGANKTISIDSTTTENVTIEAGAGSDTIGVSGSAANGQLLTINGGSPTSNALAVADVLNVELPTVGATSAVPGAAPDAGVITNPDGNISYSGIDFFNVTGAAGANTFEVRGTHDNDTIALQLLNALSRVWVNDRAVYTFTNFPTVAINGLFGDDKINVLATAANTVTTINVAGGDPTASDELLVSGTAATEAISVTPTGVDAATITGLAAVTINATTTELIKINGLGGNDALTVNTPATSNNITLTPGQRVDEGNLVVGALVPLSFLGLGTTGRLLLVDAGGADTLLYNGTDASDLFQVPHPAIATPSIGLNNQVGVGTTGIEFLVLRGLGGDDLFDIVAAANVTIFVQGDESANHSNTLNFTSTGATAVNLGASSIDDAGVAGAPDVFYSGIDFVNVDAANQTLTINGTTGNDLVTVTPTGANSGSADAGEFFPLVSYTNVAANTVSVNLLGGNDTLVVEGSAQGETITVDVPLGRVDTGALGGIVDLAGGNVEALSILALQGADAITVTPGLIPVFVDGGDPIGVVPGDQLTVNAAVGFFAGPENDEGGILTGGEDVSFDHIESLIVAPIAGCPFLILGTNGDDDITIIARDATTTPGADGVQDMTFSVNAGMNVVLLNTADVYVDALAGDDDIVVRTAAPNDANWDVNVRVAGGSPSIGAPLEADRLVIETPNLPLGVDRAIFNPSDFDSGNLILDEDGDNLYSQASTDSIINFGSFTFVCPPAAFTYTSSAGGVELVQYNGESSVPQINDFLTVNGTRFNDTLQVNATGATTGTFRSDASPLFEFRTLTNVRFNDGPGGNDVVEINGSEGPDVVNSDASTVVVVSGGVSNSVTLGANLELLKINTFGGDDGIDLNLNLPLLRKVIHAGAGLDLVNFSDMLLNSGATEIYGEDGDDQIIGSADVDTIYGGRGNDIMVGGGANDFLYGEDGNDILGNFGTAGNGIADDAGNDLFNGGAGSDTFVWEPGDGSDTIEGGAAEADVLNFFGGAGAETFNVFAKLSDPSRAILARNTGGIVMDMAGVDQINLQGNAGADSYVIGRANNGDLGAVAAPTAPYVDPTASLSDLSTTELRVINIVEAADAADNVFVDGRPSDDSLTVSVESAATGVLRVAGLPYAVRIAGSTLADRLTIRGNEGSDVIKSINPTGAGALNVEALVGITFAGGAGNDVLSADAILIGGIGNDTLEGGAGDDQLFGNEGDDTMWGGAGADTFDGGSGFDTILVQGGAGNDVIDISQTAATTLVHVVNGDTQTDTLVLNGTTRTVERVYVDSDAGADTIRVQWADSLGVDADVNSLRVDVDGGAATNDRLGVVDLGTGDLILYEKGSTDDSGTMSVGIGNAEPLVVNFVNVEVAQPIAGNGGDVVVFKHDPYEFNDSLVLATHLGANSAINVDPTINPGTDPSFGFPADQDWYRVVAETTGVLDFQVYFRQVGPVASGRPGLPNSGNLDIQVTDAAGNVIAGFGTNDAFDDERIRIPAVAGRTYYLRVFANGTAINNYNITVDNYAAPTPTDIELLDNPVTLDPPTPSNSDTGRSQFDNITRDNTPTLVFRLDDAIFLQDLPGNNVAGSPPDEVIPIAFQAAAGTPGYRIAIFDEGSSPAPGTQAGTPPQQPLGFATFVSAGVYQFTTPVLSDGTHFLTARVQMVDPATPQQTGWGPRSVALEVIVDTVVPPAFFGNSVSATDGLLQTSDSGIATVLGSFVDRITNDVTPTMYGSAEANAIMRLFVDRTNNGFTADDIFLGQTVARPLDGTNQHLGEWEITPTTGLNSPDLVATLGKDGVRRLFVTAEDVAGNISAPQTLDIMIDTTSPIISSVTYPNGDSIFQLKPMPRPTPAVTSLFVTFTGGPVSAGGFNLVAVDPGLATDVGNYQLVGDHNGNILITNAAIVTQNDTTVIVRLDFNAPLPDDRFTLKLDDSISDAAQNFLDGDSQGQSPGTAVDVLPSGNGIAGGDFLARFTVDSRPEVGAISEGLVYVDINGNMLWDPTGKDDDKTNRDFVFQFGQLVDAHFAGNFAPTGAVAASGFDKLGAYGRFAGTYSFILDTNDDGVGDFTSVMPAAYQVNGNPVAGDFNAAHPGDEIGLFDGTFWYLDTNGNNQIDLGERFASNFNGIPIVGDFTGDGDDDLAAYNNSANQFLFDTNRDGLWDFAWNVADDVNRFVGLSGFTDRPVAGDLNLDGIDDIGLWVKDRQGTLPRDGAEYYFWVSDRIDVSPANVFDAYSPEPLGNDLFAQFGDELALPIFGNFDPPLDNSSQEENLLQRQPDPLDINGDGFVTAIDALLAINVLNTYPNIPANSPVRAFYTIGQVKADTNGDRTVSAIDALLVINELNRRVGANAEGEGSSASQYASAVDSFFEDLGDEVSKRRRAR